MAALHLQQRVRSQIDNTQKFLFITSEDKVLEVSYIDKNDGKDILCVPTQSGCTQGCLFCHMTGSGVPSVNLEAHDIVEAVKQVRETLGLTGEKPLLISYMGCGEPLCNSEETVHSMIQLQAQIPQVRFAMATILPQGSAEGFIRLGHTVRFHKLNLKIHLSMHFTEDYQRQRWMPRAETLRPSLDLLRWYRSFTGNKIEVHYTPIDAINETTQSAYLISKMVGDDILVKLLQFNPKENLQCRPSDSVGEFESWLNANGVMTETYTPPGRDIGASCGQFDLQFYKARNPVT